MDSTWGAGFVNSDKQFEFKFEEFFFAPEPEQLIYTHFPEIPQWQLLPKALSREEFEELIPVHPFFFTRNIQLVSHNKAKIETGKIFLILISEYQNWNKIQ